MGLLKYLKIEIEEEIVKTGQVCINFSTIYKIGDMDQFISEIKKGNNYKVEVDQRLELIRIKQ